MEVEAQREEWLLVQVSQKGFQEEVTLRLLLEVFAREERQEWVLETGQRQGGGTAWYAKGWEARDDPGFSQSLMAHWNLYGFSFQVSATSRRASGCRQSVTRGGFLMLADSSWGQGGELGECGAGRGLQSPGRKAGGLRRTE